MTIAADFNSGFDRNSSAEDVTEGLDLTGKKILITGVGSGLGGECLRVLSMRGAHIIGLDRTMADAKAACDAAPGVATPFECDLSDPDSIRACCDDIKGQFSSIDVILTNAGIMSPPLTIVHKYTQPLEIQFAVNYLGHFVLINRLMSLVEAAPSGRIALVASDGYVSAPKKTGIDFDDLDCQNGYNALTTYGQSKLAVMLMNKVLAERLEGSNITTNAIHPGVIRTNLAKDTKSFVVKLIGAFAGPWVRTIAQGAATHCFVSVHPSIEGVSGIYFADCNPKAPEKHANDMELGRKLWAKAEELAADYLV